MNTVRVDAATLALPVAAVVARLRCRACGAVPVRVELRTTIGMYSFREAEVIGLVG
jgi:hypothetical protein